MPQISSVSAAGRRRGRGPPLLPPPRASIRSASAARSSRNLREARRRRRRQHAHAATGPHAVPVELAHLGPQGQGGGACAAPRAAAEEGPDPRAVPESHLPVGRRLRRRADGEAAVRQARPRPDAGRSRRRGGSDPRALRAVAVGESGRGDQAQPRRAARMREEKAITADQERVALNARLAFKPYVAPSGGPVRVRREFLRQQFRNEFGGDHPPDWQVRTTIVPQLQEVAERAVENGLRRLKCPTSRRRWSRSTREPATCWPWSAGATSASRPTTGRDEGETSARLRVQALRLRRCTRTGLLAGVRAVRPRIDAATRSGRVDAATTRTTRRRTR